MHCGRHPYSRHTLRLQEPMKQRRAEKYRKSFVRTPIPPARPRRRRRIRSGKARNVTIPLEQSGIAFRVSRETRSRSQHHTSCRAHGAWSVCRCTTGERIGVLLESGSLLPHVRAPQVCPGDSHTETLSLTYAVSLRESLHTGLAESRHRTSCTRRWAVSSPLSSGTTSPRSSNSVPLSGSVFTCRRRTSPAPGHGGGRKPTPE